MPPRYRRFCPALRGTPEYRGLSRPGPNARTLVEWMVTGDCTTIIPGLFCAGRAAIFEQLGWDEEPEPVLRRIWAELIDSGLLKYDPASRLCWLPWMVAPEYLPDQPNVLESWGHEWVELPDCPLKHQAWLAFREAFHRRQPKRPDKREAAAAAAEAGAATAYLRKFEECCPEPRSRPVRSEAHREPQSEALTEPQSEPEHEGRSEPHQAASDRGSDGGSNSGSAEGSAEPSSRGSLQKQKQEKKQEQIPPCDAGAQAGARAIPGQARHGPPADPADESTAWKRFGELAGAALGIARPIPPEKGGGLLGMPQKASTMILAAWHDAKKSGHTLDDLLLLGRWIGAGGLRWRTPAYGQLTDKLEDAIQSARAWQTAGEPELDDRGHPVRQRRGPPPTQNPEDDALRSM